MADMAEPAPPVSLPAKPVVVVPAEQRPEVSAPPPEAGWSMSSWKWDPYNLRATAVLPGEGEVAAGRQMGNGETAPPASTAAPVPLQPPLVPSYAMSTGSRAKGPPTCQVEFCEFDLTGLKEYHQRYKICEFHLKIHSVVREGKRQRFCQQCGRFHVLSEFDGDKRSCRARLQRHNARRRKKTETDAASKAFGSNKKATPKSDPSPADQAAEHAAPSHVGLDSQQQMQYAAQAHREEAMPEASGESRPRNDAYVNRPGALGGLQWAQTYPGRGQGLPEPSGSSGVYLRGQGGPDMYNNTKYMAPLDLSTAAVLQHYENSGAFLGPPVRRSAPAHLRELYYDGGKQAEQMQGHMTMHPPLEMQYRGMHPGMDSMHMLHPGMAGRLESMPHSQEAGPSFTGPPPTQEAARALTFPDREPYISEETLARVSAKLFQCSPAKLPADIKHNMVKLLGCGSNRAEGYIRPGCVHFTITATTSHAQARSIKEHGVRHIMESLLASRPDVWGVGDILIQLNDEIGFLCSGRIQHVLSCTASQAFFPAVTSISSQVEHGWGPLSVQISGPHLAGRDTTVLGRCQGHYVQLEWAAFTGQASLPSNNAKIVVTLPSGLPGGLAAGVVYLEVVQGSMVSQPKALLVLNDALAAAEVRQLEQNGRPGELEALLMDLDAVLELRNTTAALLEGVPGPKRPYDDKDVARAAGKARSILAFAAARGWQGVAGLVLPVALADGLPMREAFAAGGPRSLLYLAVRSGCSGMVALLLEWASSQGFEPDVLAGQPVGLLHLSRLQPSADCYELLHELYSYPMPEPSAGKPEPETSPFQAASSCGCGDAWTSGTHESKPEQAGQEAAPEASVPERTHSAYMSDLEAGPLLSEAEDCDCSDAQCRASNDSEHSAMAVAEPASPPGQREEQVPFVPVTPKASMQLRRRHTPPSAENLAPVLQAGSSPAPVLAFDQAADKASNFWASLGWVGAACSKLPQLPSTLSLHCNSPAMLVAGIGLITLLVRNYMEAVLGSPAEAFHWKLLYQSDVRGAHGPSSF